MGWRKSRHLVPIAAMVGFGLIGCQNPQSAPDEPSVHPGALDASNVRIENDLNVLESNVLRNVRPLTVAPKSAPGVQLSEKSSERELGVRLTEVAQVAPPVVEGLV